MLSIADKTPLLLWRGQTIDTQVLRIVGPFRHITPSRYVLTFNHKPVSDGPHFESLITYAIEEYGAVEQDLAKG